LRGGGDRRESEKKGARGGKDIKQMRPKQRGEGKHIEGEVGSDIVAAAYDLSQSGKPLGGRRLEEKERRKCDELYLSILPYRELSTQREKHNNGTKKGCEKKGRGNQVTGKPEQGEKGAV